MNEITQAALKLTRDQVAEGHDSLLRACKFAERTMKHGGPDFTDRIETLRLQAESLVNDIEATLPE